MRVIVQELPVRVRVRYVALTLAIEPLESKSLSDAKSAYERHRTFSQRVILAPRNGHHPGVVL